jgi:hypothetical protein
MDQTLPAPHANGSYSAWGTGQPDNAAGAELCGAANRSLVNRTHTAWGWSDELCSMPLVHMCEVSKPTTARYFSLATQNNYLINTSVVDSFEADESCRRIGGFVTSYT